MSADCEEAALVLGTAGHIDHGKSALVEALTGIDPDRLEEEKRRGITIELGFAQLALPDGRTLGVVDVPGHERFVRQMIAGSTGIDIALLCIAADDGIMPQTLEHLRVIELLGIPKMLVALTKTDLVDGEWIEFVEGEVRERLAATPYRDSPIVPVSAKTGDGLAELVDAIASLADGMRGRSDSGPARMPIDRSFTIKGAGTVVTGTLWSGTIRPDDELELLPAGTRCRVRGIQQHGRDVKAAHAGTRTAVNIADASTDQAKPGMFLATPGAIEATDRFDAWLSYLGAAKAKPLESGARLRIAHGTAEAFGRVLLMDGNPSLEPGESAFAQIRLEEPLPLSRDDRFIVRSMSPVEVVGGGRVLVCRPRRRSNLSHAERGLLAALRDGDRPTALRCAIQMKNAPFTSESLCRKHGFETAWCRDALEGMADSKAIVRLEGSSGAAVYVEPRVLGSLASAVDNALLAFHARNPQRTGVGKSQLLDLLGGKARPETFDALLGHLRSCGAILWENGEASHPKAGAGAKRREAEAADVLREALSRSGLTPPTVDELAASCSVPVEIAHRALGSLAKQGEAVGIAGFYFSAEAVEEARKSVVSYLDGHGSATAAELKDALGVSRKHAIPLLEHLDAQGVTRRQGDRRELAR